MASLYDELPLALPWYDNLKKQDRFRFNAAEDMPTPQLAPSNGLLSFQCRKVATSERPRRWYVMNLCNDMVYDSNANIGLLTYGTYNGHDYIVFNDDDNPTVAFGGPGEDLNDGGSHVISTGYEFAPGDYYFKMEFSDFGGYSMYSEVFRVPQGGFAWGNKAANKYISLTWKKSGDLPPVKYSDAAANFKNLLYLDTFITACEPEIIKEPLTDGNLEDIPVFQKAILKYKISAVVPNYLATALMLLPMHESIELRTEYDRRRGNLKNIELAASIDDDGAHSIIDLTFEGLVLFTDTTLIKSVAADEYEPITDILTVDYSVCASAETIYIQTATNPIPVGYYGQLWGKFGIGGTPTLLIPYISGHDINTGTTQHYIGLSGFTRFSIKVKNFGGYTAEDSTYDLPGAPAC